MGWLQARRAERRQNAKDDSSENGNHECGKENSTVGGDGHRERDFRDRWNGAAQHASGPDSEQHGNGTAAYRKNEAFSEQLANKTSARGTDREPNGHFTAARDRTNQQQIGDVGTGQQEHDSGHG